MTPPEAIVVPILVEPSPEPEFEPIVVCGPLPPITGPTIVAVEVVRLGYAIIDVEVERLEPGPVMTVTKVEYNDPVPVIVAVDVVVVDPVGPDPGADDEPEPELDELEPGEPDELEELGEPELGEELEELLEEDKHPTG